MSHRLPENVGLSLVGKVEPDLSVVPLEGVEVRSWRLVLELVVDLLVKHQHLFVHVKDPDVVGPLEVVLDKANNATGPLVPSVTVTGPLTPVNLNPKFSQFVAMNSRFYHVCRSEDDGGVNDTDCFC